MEKPQVSVCLPAFNAEAYLMEAVQSVQRQSFPNWELIIMNNASRDQTSEILRRLLAINQDSRIYVHQHVNTLSMVQNWNSAIHRAQGQYLKLLCADDILMPDCLERQVQALERHPTVVLASGSRVIINQKGKQLFKRNGIGNTGVYSGTDVIRRCILSGTNIIGDPVNVLWRRSAMEQAGKFDPEVLYCTDVEFWLRLLQEGDFYFDRTPTGYYRIHSTATANSLSNITVEDFLRTVDKVIQRGGIHLSRTQLRHIRLRSWYKNKIRRFVYRILG